MRRRELRAGILGVAALCAVSFSRVADAQGTGAESRAPAVLFICEHGTVKSLLAKVLFERRAKEAGLQMTAVSRGTNLQAEVPAFMQQGLTGDSIRLGAWRPRALAASDLVKAAYVVSFDVPASVSAGATVSRAQWDGLPAVSENYAVARDAIDKRVRGLVDSLKSVQSMGRIR